MRVVKLTSRIKKWGVTDARNHGVCSTITSACAVFVLSPTLQRKKKEMHSQRLSRPPSNFKKGSFDLNVPVKEVIKRFSEFRDCMYNVCKGRVICDNSASAIL